MGYYGEKKEYEKEKSEKDFCNVCGISLNSKNIKGKCINCGGIICKRCAKVKDNKVICLNCKTGHIKRKPGFFYYIDKEGNVCEHKLGKRFLGIQTINMKERKILSKVKRKPGILYYIDKEGNICDKNIYTRLKKKFNSF